jgi:heptosyltransferase-2
LAIPAHLCSPYMSEMKILVRLPNWLGDVVMAAGFMQGLQAVFPAAKISVMVKRGIQDVLPFFPSIHRSFVFDKTVYKGVAGAWRFGRELKKQDSFDLFFCLPDSFSSGLIGWASGAKKRIGYKGQGRSFLFTHAYPKPQKMHRADVYLNLLETYTKHKLPVTSILLKHTFAKEEYIVVNINSEASSRRLTEQKAVEVLGLLQNAVSQKIILIGAPKEVPFVHGVLKKLGNSNIESRAGKTDLPQLVKLLASAKLLLTTDSGPAHLANALGTYTVVLFGAGNEEETAPCNRHLRTIIRLNQLSCEPCEKNVCVRYETPQCLERLDSAAIVSKVAAYLSRPTA